MAEVPQELAAEVQKLERYHAENPQGRYFVPLANAYRKMGETEQAEALLREGLRRHPDYLSAHIVLGRCLADRGAADEAAAEFRHVLSVDPQNLIALRSLGELAGERGRSDEAARWYRELLAVDPMNEDARSALETLAAPPPPPARAEWETPAPDADDGGFLAGALDWTLPADAPDETPAASSRDDAAGWGTIELDAVDVSSGRDEPADSFDGMAFGSLDLAETAPEPPAGGSGAVGWDPLAEGSLDLDPPLYADAAPEEDEEVVTETIAELYARQGFYDRAAEVYRELIRRRGGDPDLSLRLAEVEALAAGETPQPAPPPPPEVLAPRDDLALPDFGVLDLPVFPEAGQEPTGTGDDLFAASFEHGFEPAAAEPDPAPAPAAAAGANLAEPSPAAEAPPPGAGTVRDYLASLVAWRPGAGAPAAAPRAPEPEPGVEDLPWLALPEEEPAAPPPAPEAPGLPALSMDEGFPWESAPGTPAASDAGPVPAPAAEEPPAVDTTGVGGFSFEEFFMEPPAAAAPSPAAEPPAPAPHAAEPSRAEPQPPAAPAQDAPAGGDEDEDLESFQAWLQSLKR